MRELDAHLDVGHVALAAQRAGGDAGAVAETRRQIARALRSAEVLQFVTDAARAALPRLLRLPFGDQAARAARVVTLKLADWIDPSAPNPQP